MVAVRETLPYKPGRSIKASWRNGYAEDCKSLYGGSIPSEASMRAILRDFTQSIQVSLQAMEIACE